MARLVLVRQGSGSPDVLALEAWQALFTGEVFAAPDEPLALRLGQVGIAVTPVARASREALRASERSDDAAPGEDSAPRRKELRLLAHVHERTAPGAAALAGELASLALGRENVTFILPDVDLDADAVTRAVMERALRGDLEVEVVIGRAPKGHVLLDLVQVMHRLRAPGGCPWDRQQTHETLARYLIDETYELLEAIEGGAREHLAEELGDVLLQVVFHAEMAAEERSFDVDDVADALVTKLVRRHPHVFGDVEVEGAREVVANWDVIKEHEKGRTSVLDGVPEALPALAYAEKILRRAARTGLPPAAPPGPGSLPAPETEARLGDLLLELAASSRAAGLDAETALRRAAKRLRDRIARVEASAAERGSRLADLTEDERRRLWEEAAG